MPIEGPWELPQGWAWARASDFADVVGGGTPKNAKDQANFDRAGIPWITPADLSGYQRSTIARGARSLSRQGYAQSSANLLPKGTVLVSSRAPIGYCAVADDDVCTNQGFKSLRLRGEIDPFYLRYFVLFARPRLYELASGTTFKELSAKAMGRVLFPIAPTTEQRRIVARIDELFAEIADGEAALAEAREGLDLFRRALLKAVAIGETMPPLHNVETVTEERSDPGHAAGWRKATIEDVKSGPQRNGISVAGSSTPPGIKALRLDALTDSGLDLGAVRYIPLSEQVASKFEVKPGDFLVSRANGSPRLVGRGVFVEALDEAVVFPDTMIRYPLGSSATLGRWLELVWNGPIVRAQIVGAAKSTAGILKISQSDIGSFEFTLPSATQMKQIVEYVSELLDAKEAADTHLAAASDEAARLKQSVLKAAFEGRLVPQDAADEPADQLLARIRQAQASTPSRKRRTRASA